MQKRMLQAKLHRAKVTHADLHYEGSCGIDKNLLNASGLIVNQYIEIYNVSNGMRFSTYVIEAKAGSGEISLNGAAARCAAIGDVLIICAYSDYDASELATHKPVVVLLDDANKPQRQPQRA